MCCKNSKNQPLTYCGDSLGLDFGPTFAPTYVTAVLHTLTCYNNKDPPLRNDHGGVVDQKRKLSPTRAALVVHGIQLVHCVHLRTLHIAS